MEFVNLLALLLCLYTMKNFIDIHQYGWASIAGFGALFNAFVIIL